MANVRLKNASKSFGTVHVLHDISLDIEDGEFVTLVGPSGCGKSTLLRMIAGLEDITTGELKIDGEVVNDIPPKGRGVAMVFQNYALYPHLTVEKNMGFGLKIAGTPKDEIQQRVSNASDILGLEPYLKRKPGQLSGGQRQRVAMGRAIVRDPRVFLFDEPLSNLDAKLRVKVRSEIKELHARLNTTTVYVTHEQIEAMTMADKIVIMRDGRIEQVGTPDSLYNRPANTFVAGFIGSPAMNLVEVNVQGGLIRVGGFVGLEKLATGIGAEAGTITLGVRPEEFVLNPSDGDTLNCIAARVRLVEPTGPERLLVCDSEFGEITAIERGTAFVQKGDEILLELDPSSVHLFDTKTGLRRQREELTA